MEKIQLPPRAMAASDCLALGGLLVAVISHGGKRTTNETELLLFRRWFETVHAVKKSCRKKPSSNAHPKLVVAVKRTT